MLSMLQKTMIALSSAGIHDTIPTPMAMASPPPKLAPLPKKRSTIAKEFNTPPQKTHKRKHTSSAKPSSLFSLIFEKTDHLDYDDLEHREVALRKKRKRRGLPQPKAEAFMKKHEWTIFGNKKFKLFPVSQCSQLVCIHPQCIQEIECQSELPAEYCNKNNPHFFMCSKHTPKCQGRDCEDPRGRCKNEVGNVFSGKKCLGKIFSYREIQELLPQRHPDKIVPILNYWTYAAMCSECIKNCLEFKANYKKTKSVYHGFGPTPLENRKNKTKQEFDYLYND